MEKWRHEDVDMETRRHGHGDGDMDIERKSDGKRKLCQFSITHLLFAQFVVRLLTKK